MVKIHVDCISIYIGLCEAPGTPGIWKKKIPETPQEFSLLLANMTINRTSPFLA